MPSLSGRGTGWVRNRPNPAALLFSAHRAAANLALPPRATLVVPPAYDQDALGSCTANGTVLCVAILALKRGLYVFISRLMVYLESRKLLGPQYVSQDSGAMPDDALSVVAKGLAGPETLWPYVISKFTQKPPPEAYAAAQPHSLKSYVVHNSTEAKQAIVAGFPVNFGFDIRQNAQGVMQIDRIGPDGVYPWDPNEAQSGEGHDTVIVGYDDGDQCFIVANSWGANWGVAIPGQEARGRGAYRMPYKMFDSTDVSDRSAVTDWQ